MVSYMSPKTQLDQIVRLAGFANVPDSTTACVTALGILTYGDLRAIHAGLSEQSVDEFVDDLREGLKWLAANGDGESVLAGAMIDDDLMVLTMGEASTIMRWIAGLVSALGHGGKVTRGDIEALIARGGRT